VNSGIKSVIVCTGGGTGGHVFPGLAVIKELKTRYDSKVFWIGSKKGIEKAIIERSGIPFHGIPSGKLRRYFSLKNIFDIFRIFGGLFSSFFILRKIKPDALFSKGGYVSVPPVIAAGLLKIPVITHESDVDPGLATRINSRFADKICVSWEETFQFFSENIRHKLQLTGNPVREEFMDGDAEKGREILGFPKDGFCILILGGSLGARQINLLVREMLPDLLGKAYIVHQTGEEMYAESSAEGYKTFPFIYEELPDIFAAADIIISRAGANILSEGAALGKPFILIPLSGSGTRGDQVRNAGLFTEKGAALMFMDEDVKTEKITPEILRLVNNRNVCREMGEKAKALSDPLSARKIADIIQECTGK